MVQAKLLNVIRRVFHARKEFTDLQLQYLEMVAFCHHNG